MLFTLLLTGFFLSTQALPAHLPGHVHDHVIPPHHVAPVTHARLVSETVESRNEQLEPSTETVSIAADANDGFDAPVNADASIVSESSSETESVPSNTETVEVSA